MQGTVGHMKIIPTHKLTEAGRKLLHNDHYIEIIVILLGKRGKLLEALFFTFTGYGHCLQACEENGPHVRNYMFKVLEVWGYCWTLPN
jgi:hypothetical protein